MTEITIETAESRPIIAVTRNTTMSPTEIGKAMQADFQVLGQFIAEHGINPIGPPIAVYTHMNGDNLTYELGFPVGSDDLRKAEGQIHAYQTPGGKVLRTTHMGPYSEFGKTYDLLEEKIAREGLRHDGPVWEVYVNDPASIPESELLTEIFVRVA